MFLWGFSSHGFKRQSNDTFESDNFRQKIPRYDNISVTFVNERLASSSSPHSIESCLNPSDLPNVSISDNSEVYDPDLQIPELGTDSELVQVDEIMILVLRIYNMTKVIKLHQLLQNQ